MADREETAPHVAGVRELALEGAPAIGAPVAIPPRSLGERVQRAIVVALMIALAVL
jgi:hypothetical protein